MEGYEYWAWHGTDGEIRECRRLRVLLLVRYLPSSYAWWLNHVADPLGRLSDRARAARQALRDEA